MTRITQKHLDATVERINRVTKNELTPYTQKGEKFITNIGNYHISYAYGGASLHQMQTEGGGISDVFRCGHITKRDLYERMHAFLTALEQK